MRVEGINKFDEPAHPFVVCPVSLDGGALAGMAFVNVSKNADEKVVVFLFFLARQSWHHGISESPLSNQFILPHSELFLPPTSHERNYRDLTVFRTPHLRNIKPPRWNVRLWLLADIQPHPELRPLYSQKRTFWADVKKVCF